MVYALLVPGPINDMVDVRILQWHREEGAPVSTGDLILELETTKAVVEIRAAQNGILRRQLCAAGEWRRMGNPLALLSDDSDTPLPQTASGLPEWQAEFQLT